MHVPEVTPTLLESLQKSLLPHQTDTPRESAEVIIAS